MESRLPRLAPAAAGLITALTLAFATTPAPAAAQSACGGFYMIQTGDNLAEVAERCGVTIPALLAVNPGVADERDLEVGDRLRIPNPSARQPSPVEACGPTYAVRTGDTIREIALKCGLTVPLLVAANGPLPQPLGVHTGLRLRIPNVPRSAVDDPTTIAAARTSVGVDTVAADASAAALEPTAADTAADTTAVADAEELVRVEGILESGPTCWQVRTSGGERIAIAGEASDAFEPGDRVVLMGTPAAGHDCGGAETLELRIMYRSG